jgi:hypothetical protein
MVRLPRVRPIVRGASSPWCSPSAGGTSELDRDSYCACTGSAEAEFFHPNQALQLKPVEFALLRTLHPGETAGGQAWCADEHQVNDLRLADSGGRRLMRGDRCAGVLSEHSVGSLLNGFRGYYANLACLFRSNARIHWFMPEQAR